MVRKVLSKKVASNSSANSVSVSKKKISHLLPFEGRLSSPDATVHLPSFGPFSFSITVDAVLSKGKVKAIGFSTNGPRAFKHLVSRACLRFAGKDEDAIEFLTFDLFLAGLVPSPAEHKYALYAWTVLQDVCTRLPFNDPLSKAIGKIHSLNSEFKYGTLLPDLED